MAENLKGRKNHQEFEEKWRKYNKYQRSVEKSVTTRGHVKFFQEYVFNIFFSRMMWQGNMGEIKSAI